MYYTIILSYIILDTSCNIIHYCYIHYCYQKILQIKLESKTKIGFVMFGNIQSNFAYRINSIG
jgi:hypothetical protein